MLRYEGEFRGGVFVPDHPLPWEDRTRVLVTVIEDDCEGIHVRTAGESPGTPSDRASQRDHGQSGTPDA